MKGYPFVIEQCVTWRDLDALGHVNNAVYATYFETARLEFIAALTGDQAGLNNLILADLQISFKSPAFLRERLLIGVRISEIRNSSFVVESEAVEKESGRLVAVSRAVVVHYDYDANRSVPVSQEWREAVARFQGAPS